MFNKVILIGRLVADPQLRYTQSGKPVVNFRIAVDRRPAQGESEAGADFIDVVAWNKLAETVAHFLGKGRLVAVDGRLQIRSYEASDGSRRRVAEVVATEVRFLDSPRSAGEASAPGEESVEGEEDVPF